jgi:hypothetical protein
MALGSHRPALGGLSRTRWPPVRSTGTGRQCSTNTKLPLMAWAYYAKGVSTRLMKQAKGLDPLYHYIGIGSDPMNWMPDTGASSPFIPCLLDFQEVEEGLDLGVDVADCPF